MSYPEDPTPSATPYGEAGDMFGDADVVSQSPTTSERVVDTQSGYLVVLKKVDGTRVALSVKRRLGTPPSSSILLTPDEQVKLAKILADAKAGFQSPAARVSPRAQRYTHQVQAQRNRLPSFENDELGSLGDAPEREFARVSAERLDEDGRSHRRRRASLNRAQIVAIVVAAILIPVGLFSLFNKPANNAKPAVDAKQAEATAAAAEDARIDRFVRGFVGDMLDFNQTTYRSSQIHAMAVMTPELLDKYWKETNFPLTKEQLAQIPKGRTLIITKVTQEAAPEQTKNVDLFAELASANNKISTPVHLRLKVGYGLENQLRVLDQKDLSTAK